MLLAVQKWATNTWVAMRDQQRANLLTRVTQL